ncbi:MAG: hypothetical protein IJU13_05450 [Bacteroidales bacterium]|nr:hypothetical protein [Bacteroidales bacterium]
MKIEEAPIDPQVDVFYQGHSILGAECDVEFEQSVVLDFTCKGVSMVKAEMPRGWKSVTSMSNNTLTLTAPAYSDKSAAKTGEVTVKAYDGTGSFLTRSFRVSAMESGGMTFSVVSPSIASTVSFTMGKKILFNCNMSSNIGNFNFTLPTGWTAQWTEQGFSVTAPVYTPTSGDAQSGTIQVVPVTWSGVAHPELKVSVPVEVTQNATFQFEDPGKCSFTYGQTQEIAMICKGVQSIVSCNAPAGWTVDYSQLISGGFVRVTAPAKASMTVGRGNLSFTATQVGSSVNITSEGEMILRLYGLNDADDVREFTDAYGNKSDTPTYSGETIAPYLVNGELTLNADITIPSNCIAWGAYWLKRLMIPLNGNGHTLTISTQQAERGGLFQNVCQNVHDLNISGTVECTGGDDKNIRAGSLASFVSADGITIKNVRSNVNIKANNNIQGQVLYIGGLVSLLNDIVSQPKKLTFDNCHFTGTITTTKSVEAVGGILGAGGMGAEITFRNCSSSAVITCTGRGVKGIGGIAGGTGTSTNPGEVLYIYGCTFSGTINYVSDGNYNTRIGGILGNVERGTEMAACTFSGTINADMKGKNYFGSDPNYRGIGGIIGRDAAPVADYPNLNARAILDECISNGTISITQSGDTPAVNASHVGQITGLQINFTESHSENNCTSTSTINISYAD